jgi:hypothetical protein
MRIVAANREYERWLAAQLRGSLVKSDLDGKHKKMSESAFCFLRATYWRWAETILEVCPELATAPSVLAVGDIHLENFGTWRDQEGRVVWGVNDHDEAAAMPYLLDVVRLAASARLASTRDQLSLKEICTSVLDGYRRGIEGPEAFILDRQHMWLRTRFVVSEDERAKFWQKIESQYQDSNAKKNAPQPPAAWRKLFASALPEPITLAYWPRTAGTGSLGRPRWLGYGTWRNGPLLRECKALVASGWTRAQDGPAGLHLNDIARGRYRSPDPWYQASGNLLVRRLSPNNQKIDVAAQTDLLHVDLLWAMGRELAAVHLGQKGRRDAVRKDLETRKRRAFRDSVERAAEFVTREYAEWKKSAK